MQGLKAVTGYMACPICLQVGKILMIKNNCMKKASTVRYLKQEEDSEQRTHSKMLKSMKNVANKLNKVNTIGNKTHNDGVTKVSPMVVFKYFDLINSFNTDY